MDSEDYDGPLDSGTPWEQSPIRILCFGSRFQGDDGFGGAVYDELRSHPLPEGVTVFDAGICSVGSALLLEGCRHAVVVDSVRGLGTPGQIFRLAPAALPAHVSAYSSHALGLNHLFDTLPISLGIDAVPTIEIIGAEVGRIQPFSQTLSPEVAGAVKPAAALVRRACSLASSKIVTGHGGDTTHGATTTAVTRL